MGFLFFDDSKHPKRGFSLGAFVYTATDPTKAVHEAIARRGFQPGADEFKSSAHMGRNPKQALLREDLRQTVRHSCQLGVVVVPSEAELGPEALRLLDKMLQHGDLKSGRHEVFFDEGLFPSARRGEKMSQASTSFDNCQLHFEQNSKHILGIQLADLVSHTCAIMLAQTLGLVRKTVKAGDNSGDDAELDIDLGFELWAHMRYNFLSTPPPHPDNWKAEELQPVADIQPYGLHISASVGSNLRNAAVERFGSMYLGCIN